MEEVERDCELVWSLGGDSRGAAEERKAESAANRRAANRRVPLPNALVQLPSCCSSGLSIFRSDAGPSPENPFGPRWTTIGPSELSSYPPGPRYATSKLLVLILGIPHCVLSNLYYLI